MTTQDTVPAVSDSSGNVITKTIRYGLIVVAAMSLVGLSIHALGLQYSEVLVKTLHNLKEWVGYTPLFEFLEEKIRFVAAYLSLPEFHLGEWWRDTFTLLWLYNGSFARNRSRGEGWVFFWIAVLWAGITALVAAIATGTVLLNSWTMVLWPLASTYGSELVIWLMLKGRPWWVVPSSSVFIVLFVLLGYYARDVPVGNVFGLVVPSPGLMLLAAFVLMQGFFALLVGEHYRLMGRDILGAIGIALVVAVMGLL